MLYGADKWSSCVDSVRQHRRSLVNKPAEQSLLPSPKPSGKSGALVVTQTLTFPVSGANSRPAELGSRPPIEGQSSPCNVESAPSGGRGNLDLVRLSVLLSVHIVHCNALPTVVFIYDNNPPLGHDVLVRPWSKKRRLFVSTHPTDPAGSGQSEGGQVANHPSSVLYWPSQTWFADLCSVMHRTHWAFLRNADLLTQWGGEIFKPSPAQVEARGSVP